MLGKLIEDNYENIAYVNDLELVKCQLKEFYVILENEEETLMLDTLSKIKIIDDYNIRVKKNTINFSVKLVF